MPDLQTRLAEIAPAIQTWLAINREAHYSETEIEQALTIWLERSLDSLLDEALYHCVAGSAVHAVGRHDFQLALSNLHSL